MELITYQIDRSDRIVSVDEAWSTFAIANGAPSLAGDAVLGTLLWDYIADEATRWIYQEIVGRVRRSALSCSCPFRCDAPDLRRFMHMDVMAAGEGLVCFVCRVERLEARAPIAWALPLPPGQQFIRICSGCKRVEMRGLWRELDEVVAGLGPLADAIARPFTQGICTDCATRLRESLKS
jgi:hypothetical protein